MSVRRSLFLAADIGGTNARFALFDADHGKPTDVQVLSSAHFRSAEAAVASYLTTVDAEAGRKVAISAACIAVAGPVSKGECRATNLPWVVRERSLQRAARTPHVRLVNDLVALLCGAASLPARQHVNVLPGSGLRPKAETVAMIASGTGLGEAALLWDGLRHVPMATESGHGDFAPRGAVQRALLAQLEKKHGRVSYERVASGMGLGEVYAFARTHVPRGAKLGPKVSAAARDANRTIVAQGLRGDCAAARLALDLVIAVLGAEAGNLALRTGARGGIFLGGGLAEALAPRLLATETFRDAFVDKGRFRPVMEKVPVVLVQAPLVGLRGAGRLARDLFDGVTPAVGTARGSKSRAVGKGARTAL